MARGCKQIVVKISHSCAPDPDRVERGLEMWAAFLADEIRKQSGRTKGRRRSARDAC